MSSNNFTMGILKSMYDYDGIYIDKCDAPKLVDIYLRIIKTITTDDCDNTTSLEMDFDGSQFVDFNSMDDTGIESIKNYISLINQNASYKLSDQTMNSLMNNENIKIVFQRVHQFIGTIYNLAVDYNDNCGYCSLFKFSYEDYIAFTNSFFDVSGYMTTDKKTILHIVSTLVYEKLEPELEFG